MLLLDYSIKTSKIDNGKPYWNYTLCEIYKGEEKIGEYKRTYPSFAKETFFAFSFKGKDYALYSSNYTKIQLMSLPDCQEIPLKDECVEQTANFCPTELYIPAWSNTSYDYKGEPRNIQSPITDLKQKDEYTYEYGYSHLGLALGCIWGDDSSWKIYKGTCVLLCDVTFTHNNYKISIKQYDTFEYVIQDLTGLELEYIKKLETHRVNINNFWLKLTEDTFNKVFLDLSKWRDKQINSILDD
jgi:hypothetical protein